MSDSPFSLNAPSGLGFGFDFGGAGSATTPTTVPTDGGTSPASPLPNLGALFGGGSSPSGSSDDAVAQITDAALGGIEDVAHGFGLGPGSKATQAREAAEAAAKAQQQLILIVLGVAVVGVVLYKMGYIGGGAAPSASATP